jgi:hypothetical protein
MSNQTQVRAHLNKIKIVMGVNTFEKCEKMFDLKFNIFAHYIIQLEN